MNADELARAVAAEEGAAVVAALDAPEAERTRGLTEAMAIAGFLVQSAQLALQLWQIRQDQAQLVQSLATDDQVLKSYPHLDTEKRLGLVARILMKMLPESFATPMHASVPQKQQWVTDVEAARRQAAESPPPAGTMVTYGFVGGPTILQPFADQRWWSLRDNIAWEAEPGDGLGKFRVDVPKGFVTDLASVPSYLWAFLQKTGRYGNAAIYHDWLYWQQDQWCTREMADRVFDRAMADMGVNSTTRNLIWAGVRVFGGRYWAENTREKAAGEKRVLKVFPDAATVTWEEWKTRPDVFA